MKIMIVEDDPRLQAELAKLLRHHGYEPMVVSFLESIVEQVTTTSPDLILMDINLPEHDGFFWCKEIRKISSCPILFVTSRDTEEDELKSIVSGGTDFIRKPYHPQLLLEKIKRACSVHEKEISELRVKGMTLNLPFSLLCYQGKEVELTRNEFRILYYFFLHPGVLISKEELLESLWNDKYYLDENILTVNINRLRKKAEEIGIPSLIQTVYGKGYCL